MEKKKIIKIVIASNSPEKIKEFKEKKNRYTYLQDKKKFTKSNDD